MTRPGEPWGAPLVPDEPVVDVAGADADLARATVEHPAAVLRFRPEVASDFARTLGLIAAAPGSTVVPCDALDLGDGRRAVNAVVLGPPPHRLRWWHRRVALAVAVDGRPIGPARATTVVVANGQYVRGVDVSPRGHPGDGRVEVQVYGLAAGERRAMRRRLPTGGHVPHPRIAQTTGRRVEVRWAAGPRSVVVDGAAVAPADRLTAEVRPGAYRVLL
jgi:hypothetical protein